VDMPTEGIHDPTTPYAPRAREAWGAQGDWHMKANGDVQIEEQYAATRTTETWDGRIDHERLANHEVRVYDSSFVPNAKNVAPRAANWKAGKHKNYF